MPTGLTPPATGAEPATASDRTYTLTVHYGGSVDDIDAAANGAASWIYDSLDPTGEHALTITLTASNGENLSYLVYEPVDDSYDVGEHEEG